MIKAEIVGDSINQFGNRITTMVVTMPRIILAEFNTHRMFSRNSASSRAIPFEKMVKSVKENPFIPIAWQKDHKGMQGTEYLTNPLAIEYAKKIWLKGRDYAAQQAEELRCLSAIDTDYLTDFEEEEDILITKQLCNRNLETYMYHTVIVTATEWENFFALRCPQYHSPEKYMTNPPKPVKIYRSWKDMTQDYLSLEQDASILTRLSYNKGQAEIHMMALAEAMWDAYNESVPKELKSGEWHIPFHNVIKITENWNDLLEKALDKTIPLKEAILKLEIKIATVMAARTSYTVVGDDLKPMTYDKMIILHDRLVTTAPLHASPMEHCAKSPIWDEIMAPDADAYNNAFGNFKGWLQYRKMFPNENVTK